MTDISVQLVAVAKPDGGVAIMHFITDDGKGLEREATDAAIVAEIERSGLSAVQWARIEPADLPDRATRDRWALVNGALIVQ